MAQRTVMSRRNASRLHLATRGGTAPPPRSFATYMAGRPVPLDPVERALLRFDWICRRLRRAA